MTDLILTSIRDSWVNEDRPGQNYGSAKWVQVQSTSRRGFLRPALGNIAGRTVLDAYLVGRVGPGWVAQTLTVSPVTSGWAPGQVTWANQPTVNAGAAVTEAVGALSDGALVEVDGLAAIIQAVADGADWYGLRVTTSVATAGQTLYATDSGEASWELYVTLSDAPEQPSNLRPDGGGAVSGATPILAWDFLDLGGDSTEQAKSRVQVDTTAGVPDGVTPDYDSGWEVNAEPQWALTGEYTLTGAGPHHWRVQVRDADDNESEWSDWATFGVAALPSLVVDSPTGSFGDPSPTVLAHLSTGTVKSWKAMVTGPDRSDVRAESGMQTGAVSWQVPEHGPTGRRVFREDEQGWLYLRVWDTTDRAVAVGQSPYVDVWVEADWDEDAGIDPVEQLSVRPVVANDPRLVWTWERVEAAAAYVAQVDGVTVARIEADEVEVDAGTYTWTDGGQVPPMRPHTLGLRALEDGAASAAVELTEHRHRVSLMWLVHDEVGPVALADTQLSPLSRVDRFASYTPLEGPEVDVIYDYEGRRGQVEGAVFAGWSGDDDVWEAVDRLNQMARSRIRTAQMVWGSQSIRVRLRDVDVTSHDDIDPQSALHVARFGFVEVEV